MDQKSTDILLDVRNLKTYFYTDDGVVKAVDGVDFDVSRGEVLGLVGESGCGKSVTSLSIMRLISVPGKIKEGEIFFEGRDLLKLTEAEMVNMRGDRISMIFQQPQSSLNPVFKVGDQVAEVLHIHQDFGKEEAWSKAVDLLKLVGIPDPEAKAHAYPHEMSGGQAQRVMIAMALALNPQLLIADEPTTALDVTIQAQILDLMRDLRTRLNTAVILITHDLGVIAEMADRVAVMYAGRIVEQADVTTLFRRPLHPYTQGLLASIPILGQVKDVLDVIPGSVPNLVNLPPGCRFAPRCRARLEHQLTMCTETEPELIPAETGHIVRCWLYQSSQNHKAPLEVA
jgi:oligopeptide/dipeptide ABC transporter ATP-binding protein